MKHLACTFFTPVARAISCLSLILSSILLDRGSVSVLAQPAAPAWRDTGVHLDQYSTFCFDLTHRNSLLIGGSGGKVSVLSLENNQVLPLSGKTRAGCSLSGYLYDNDSLQGKAIRYSDREPQGKILAYGPVYFGQDGSLHLYAIANERVMYSSDAGDTWQQRPRRMPGLASITVSPSDPLALYAALVEPANPTNYTIYFSPDSGVTWEQRSTGKLQRSGPLSSNAVVLRSLQGNTAPTAMVEMVHDAGTLGSGNKRHVYVSGDGGRSFSELGLRSLGRDVRLVHTHRGILRLATTTDSASATYRLTESTDGARSWRDLTGPWPADYPAITSGSVSLEVVPTAPANVFMKDPHSLWYSHDGGLTWRRFAGEGYNVYVSPYIPITVAAIESNNKNRLHVLNLPTGGKHLTMAIPASGASASTYFPATGHNLSGTFKQYWESHGGLPQFGYPRTEPFLERSDSDGKVYMVQYFERNRFEWHRENRDSPSEILLGLLGADLTSARRAAGEGGFNRIENPRMAGQLYFPQTGHTLRNSFLRYWQANGGLAIYGYPISEEFQEVNPDNGKTYVVQYFERNRFEWHPENVNTRYEVLLGALGNILLKLKGYE